MFKKVLIANRGEIALRVLRTLKDMGIKSVAVHSTADTDAMHVRLANESVCIGPPPSRESYLNKTALLAAAEITGADAIHPGFGFLSENADFAHMVEEHHIKFIGPRSHHIKQMGDKMRAKETALKLGIPLVPGSDGCLSEGENFSALFKKVGFPLLIKAAHGGGGKGMRVVATADQFEKSLQLTRAEALANFGADAVYIEKYLETPRHIELQIIGDQYKNAVVLGERDCSLQRNHQKIWEEAPAPGVPQEALNALITTVQKAVSEMGYEGVGTFEFLFEKGRFYFIEMNTRIQVEHPVTEMITGIDLIKEQIRIAAGEPLGYTQEDIRPKGHAIECRINAEDPLTFAPSPQKVEAYLPPGGPHIRVDSGLYQGYTIPPYYDSLIAKLIAYGNTRAECLAHLRRALSEYVISGPKTLIPLHLQLANQKDIIEGTYHIHWLENWIAGREQAA